MTRYRDVTDPEVLADIRFREQSEHSTARVRPNAGDKAAEHWPCKGCGAIVAVSAFELAAHAVFNRKLAKSGERPLAKRSLCPKCKERDDELREMEREAEAAARRPHEQRALALDNPNPRKHP